MLGFRWFVFVWEGRGCGWGRERGGVDNGGVCEVDVDVDVGVIDEGGVCSPTSSSNIPPTPVTPAPATVGSGGGGGGGVLTKGGVLDLAPKSDANPDVNLDAPAPTTRTPSR